MTIERQGQLRTVAARIKRMLDASAVGHPIFWEDLDTLVNLVLEKEDESNI